MKEHIELLKNIKLFRGLGADEILHALGCLNANIKNFYKGAVLFSEGDAPEYMGIVLSGEIQIQKIDFSGNVNIISKQFAGDILNAAACYSELRRLPFDTVAVSESEVLYFSSTSLVKQCCKACAFHSKIIENMLSIIADKNVRLTEKINILTKRTTREKLTAYLYGQSKKAANKKFAVPLSRKQMAEFLSVDRSAMIRELGNMRDEEIIGFEDNIFWFN